MRVQREPNMATKQAVRLGTVPETLLVPLYARAVESRRKHPILDDPKAIGMVDSIDWDFQRFNQRWRVIGCTLRSAMFDEWVKAFLRSHPEGTVVEIGCGLNTRFERLDNGRLHWFDLDLPEVIELRRKFFADSERRTTLAASVLDPDWIAAVRRSPGPYFFVAEAVLLYLTEREVKAALAQIAANFPDVSIAFDTTSPRAVKSVATDHGAPEPGGAIRMGLRRSARDRGLEYRVAAGGIPFGGGRPRALECTPFLAAADRLPRHPRVVPECGEGVPAQLVRGAAGPLSARGSAQAPASTKISLSVTFSSTPAALAASSSARRSIATGSGPTSSRRSRPSPFLVPDGERDLEAPALAGHAGAVLQLGVHRLQERIGVVHADAGLVHGRRRQLLLRRLIHVAQLRHRHSRSMFFRGSLPPVPRMPNEPVGPLDEVLHVGGVRVAAVVLAPGQLPVQEAGVDRGHRGGADSRRRRPGRAPPAAGTPAAPRRRP